LKAIGFSVEIAQNCCHVTGKVQWYLSRVDQAEVPPEKRSGILTQLRGFALDFAEGEKVFPYKSVTGLWISRELPV
jgi:hypothetical protein